MGKEKRSVFTTFFFIKLNPNSPKKGWAPLIVNYCFFNKKFNDPSKNFNDHKLTNVERTVLKVEAVIIFQERVLKFTHIIHYPPPHLPTFLSRFSLLSYLRGKVPSGESFLDKVAEITQIFSSSLSLRVYLQ